MAYISQSVENIDEGPDVAAQSANESAVHLRGLPFSANIDDIRAFLGPFAEDLHDDSAIEIICNRSSRPSGRARVQFDSPVTAGEACDVLHMKLMSGAIDGGVRYVEVFLCTDTDQLGRSRRRKVRQEPDLEEVDVNITLKQVMQECCEHLTSVESKQLHLSNLGGMLSQSARRWLNMSGGGLKEFLLQSPLDFVVTGLNGSERVTFLQEGTLGREVSARDGMEVAPNKLKPKYHERGAFDDEADAATRPVQRRKLGHTDEKFANSQHDHAEETLETDWDRRVASRQRQIEIGKSRPEYKAALRSSRRPRTPDPYARIPKREFDRAVGDWRRMLHAFDEEPAATQPMSRTAAAWHQATPFPIPRPSMAPHLMKNLVLV